MQNESPDKSLLRPFQDWRLLLYNFAIILFAPYFLLRKISRHFTKKTAYEFLRYRWTIPVYNSVNADSSAPHVVFVSTGFGEKHTTEQLTAALREVRPDVRTTWAVKAETTVNVIREANPGQSVTYMPFDFLPSVTLWLSRLRPDVVVSVEKLWVPNIAWASKRWGAPTIVVSGRRGRYRDSAGKKVLWQAINRWTLGAYDILCLQSDVEQKRLTPVLPPGADVRITGAIKMSRPSTSRPSSEVLRQWVEANNPRGLPILAAGSTTHRAEEEFVLDAFEKVRREQPCLLLLAPRHLHRTAEVLALLGERGLKVNRRSTFDQSHSVAEADVLILDSMGELSSAYGYAAGAFVGGTLQGPGHNVLEPIEWGVPSFFGFGAGDNLPATQALALEADAGFRVRSSDELAAQWNKVLQDSAWREELRGRCQAVMAEQKQALEENLRAVVEALDAARR